MGNFLDSTGVSHLMGLIKNLVSGRTPTKGEIQSAGGVTQVKVGTTGYDPSSGVVSLPAYPTSLPASDVSSWAKASSKPSYNLDEVGDGSSRKIPTKTSELTNDSGYTGNIGTVTKVKVGTTGYDPESGVISLPAYPSIPASLPANGGNAATVNGHSVNADVPAGAVFTDTNTWRPLGTGANDACAGNDSRLSNARPASDVYDWAKASSKPSYSYSEISGTPSSLPASDVYSWAKQASKPSYSFSEISGTVDASQLPSYVDDVLEYDSSSYFPSTGEGGKIYVAKDTNLTFRWTGTQYTEISKSLAIGTTAGTACAGNDSRLSDARPASDVYSWAKQASKPSYDWSEITGKPTIPTDTWRPVTNDYSGNSESTGLSQYGANALYNALVNGYASEAGYAGSAGSVAWSNVSGRPTALSSFSNDSGFITSSGSCNYASSAGNADTLDNLDSSEFYRRVVHSSMTTDIPTDLVDGVHIIHRPGVEYSSVLAMHDYNGAYFQMYVHPTDGYDESIQFRSNNTGGNWRTIIDSNNIGSQSVNHASSADNATNATNATYATYVNGHSVNSDVPSGAVFTDTNTWRPITDT